MKKNLVALSLTLGVLASGCAETGYTNGQPYPTWNSTTPLNNPVMYPNNNNNPIYNPGYNTLNQGCFNNPGMTQNCYNPNLQMNAYVQAQMNTQMMMNQYIYRQNMFSWQMRLNTPGYYNLNQSYLGCFPRPVYTTTRSCSRARSYCFGRRSCGDVVIVTTRSSNGSEDQSNTNTNHDQPCTTCSNDNTNDNNSNQDKIKILPISWKGKDAKALYDRLAREEEVIEKGLIRRSKGSFAKTGEFYKCMIEGSKKNADDYVCDLEIRVEDGMLLRQYPAGKTGTPVISGIVYEGDLLKVGMPGNTPETGLLTIAGPTAKYLFESMHSEESTGTVGDATGMEDGTEAKIRSAGAVKCFKTLNTRKEVTQCILKLKTDTGEVLDVKSGSVQTDPTPATDATPTPTPSEN
jgi:hypothetical protein